MLRLLVVALTYASFVYAADTEDRVRKSMPVSSATRLTLNAEFGSIRVQPGARKSVDVEVYFRGNPPSRGEFDRMLRDFTLDVAEQGSDVHVRATFRCFSRSSVLAIRSAATGSASNIRVGCAMWSIA